MKKLLILVLVLGMASVSYGTLTSAWYEADGSTGTIDVTVGQVVEITLVANDAAFSMQIQIINEGSRDGVAQGVVSTPYVTNTLLDTGKVEGGGANLNSRLFAPSLTTPVSSFQGVASGTLPASGADLLSFNYTVPNVDVSTTITINSYNVNDGFPATLKQWVQGAGGTAESVTSFGGVSLHIIPEPATIALLGLGGLFLVRRRK